MYTSIQVTFQFSVCYIANYEQRNTILKTHLKVLEMNVLNQKIAHAINSWYR